MPHLAMFEKIELLHRVYPVYLLGARIVAWFTYEDIEAHNFVVLQHLHAKTDRLMLMLRQMQIDTTIGAPVRPDEAPSGSNDPSSDPWGLPPSALQEQYRPLHPAMVGDAPALKGTKPQGQTGKPTASGGGRGLGSLVYFFGVYFFFQWLLGRGS